MEPVAPAPSAENPPSRLAGSRWLRLAGWLLSAVLVACVLVVGAVAWLLRPEALRQRVETALAQALVRPVAVRAVDWHWQAAPVGSRAPAQIVLRVHGLHVPERALGALGAAGGAMARRGVRVGKVAVFLRAAPREWWRAWRGESPWPVVALRADDVLSAPAVAPPGLPAMAPSGLPAAAPGDEAGLWKLAQVDLQGIVAAATAPRVQRVQVRGRWQRAPQLPWVPVAIELRELALTPGFTGSFSLDQANLALGLVQLSLARVVVGEGTATFDFAVAPVNLRAALPPLGIPVPLTEDAETFERVSAQAECHVDFAFANRGAGCDSVVLKVDDTTFTGQAWRAPRGMGGRAAVGASGESPGPEAPWQLRLAGDRLNLDRYLPPENLQEPPTAVPWNLADAWPLEVSLSVRDLRMAGLRLQSAKLMLQAGERGLVRQ